MKRFAVVFSFVLTLALVFSGNVCAQDKVWINFGQVLSGDNTTPGYGFEFEMYGNTVSQAKKVTIKTPTRKYKMVLNNKLGINLIQTVAWVLNQEEFQRRFPAGEYTVTIKPKKTFMTHIINVPAVVLPDMPDITAPAHDTIVPPGDVTVTWDALMDIDGLELEISNGDMEFKQDLPTDATSYVIPAALLTAGTQYEVCVEAQASEDTLGVGYGLESKRCVSFTTQGGP